MNKTKTLPLLTSLLDVFNCKLPSMSCGKGSASETYQISMNHMLQCLEMLLIFQILGTATDDSEGIDS
jgi:hypothetical protein